MQLAFIDRDPTSQEVERFRLVLSTYQDGSGMLALRDGKTLPGWRDFERTLAAVFNGIAQENKAIFDVLLPDPVRQGTYCGLSCKMREALDNVRKYSRVTMELSNSSRKFWQYLATKGLSQSNYRSSPEVVGEALVELVEQWYQMVSTETGGVIDLARSSYLVLSYNKQGSYQLHRFPLGFPDPRTLQWYFPAVQKKGGEEPGSHLRGTDEFGTLFEWYGESGGQLKYYPLITSATWESTPFRLEPLHLEELGSLLVRRAKTYFPELWLRASIDSN